MPLKGKNLYRIFSEGIRSHGLEPKISVHTDSNALALGEAIGRGLEADQVLAFILVTEGVGGGFVRGRDIYRSALHPELGMLPVRWKRNDRIRPTQGENRYFGTLGTMADNPSMLSRFRKLKKGKGDISREALRRFNDNELWELRAYYLAQACLACTALLAPHKIVIAADIDPDGDTPKLTRRHFNDWITNAKSNGSPVFEYDELKDDRRFISGSVAFDWKQVPITPSIRVTGAYGMCYEAADVLRRGRVSRFDGSR